MMSYNRSSTSRYNTKNSYQKKVVVKAPSVSRESRVWSGYQKDIFTFIETTTGHGFVEALAGSGKTTTLEESARRAYEKNPALKIAVVAFNKDIKEEVEARLADLPKITVKTCHGLGYLFANKAFRCGRANQKKMQEIFQSIIGPEADYDLMDQLQNCASKAKLTLAPLTAEAMDQIIDKFELELGKGKERTDNIDIVLRALELAKKQTSVIDFDDMLWLPIQHRKITPMFDNIFVDEFQDLNKAQFTLIMGALKPGGRIIAFGDRNQMLYGWAGADETIAQTFIDQMGAKVLPLSTTYRCARSIVELAQTIVPSLSAAPNAPEGTVENISYEEAISDIRPGDFFLSRKNAPMTKICMQLLRRGIPANILGSDIGKGLLWMMKKSQARTAVDLVTYCEEWRLSEKERLAEKNRNSDWVDDKADCLISFCENANSLNDVRDNIRRTFNDGDSSARVTISSIHRCKGKQTNRVFVLNDTLKQGKSKEEDNICYVAWSRTISELYIVNGMP